MKRPTSIGFPDSPTIRKKFEWYSEQLKQMLPERLYFIEQLGVYVEYLLLQQLLEDGRMVNTSTFLEILAEQKPDLHRILQQNMFVYDVVCHDLTDKIKRAQAGHAS